MIDYLTEIVTLEAGAMESICKQALRVHETTGVPVVIAAFFDGPTDTGGAYLKYSTDLALTRNPEATDDAVTVINFPDRESFDAWCERNPVVE